MRISFLVGTLLLFCVPVSAQTTKSVDPLTQSIHQGKEFQPVYSRYTQVVREHGALGLKEMITPDFTISSGEHSFKGKAALTEAYKYMDGLERGQFTVELRQLNIHGNQAIAYTKETSKYKDDQDTIGITWEWKQTWRKTSEGWKLAQMERDNRAKKTQEGTIVYTFTSRP